MNITTVFLDAGGVILDESQHEVAVAGAAVKVLSGILDGYSEQDYWRDIEEASRVFAPRIYQYVFYKHLKGRRRSFDDVYAAFLDEWGRRRPAIRLMPGLADEVRSLSRDFKPGILGQYGREVLDLLREHSLLDCFAYTYTQDDFNLTKPDPRYYEQVLEKCGVRAGECIMVGDRIDKDIVPARQVGMKTIRIRVGILKGQEPRIPFEEPDLELTGVKGLADAVRRLAARH
jgi:HAD superfamily hydrolase (TIGR01549 family)